MMQRKLHLLVFRFSSLGDVAMTVPVVKLLLKNYPDLYITMVSTAFMEPLFNDIERLDFYVADLKGKHKGVTGLYKLYSELKSIYVIDAIVDLHNVLRTKILVTFFSFSKKPIAVIDKGRKEKEELTRQQNKFLRPLKSTFQRYADVFEKLGFPMELFIKGGLKEKAPTFFYKEHTDFLLVGISPFALHKEKMYPPDRMREVIRLLKQNNKIHIYLFGSKQDEDVLRNWQEASVESTAGIMNFASELELISQLDIMVSMDSANMHLASLYGVPVVSIWGGTHPYLGFYGWGQSADNAVQVDMDCRPSSVFGNKQCVNNLACMKAISPVVIYDKIMTVLQQKNLH